MNKKERLVGIIMTILISTVMGLVAAFLLIKTNPNALMASSATQIYVSNILLSLLLGFVVAFVVPLGRIGNSLARKAGAVPPSIKYILINAIPLAVGNTVIISLPLSFVGVFNARRHLPPETLEHLPPFPIMWLGSWFKLLIPTLIISYILSVILAPIVARIVGVGRPGAGGPPKGVKQSGKSKRKE